jgi:hypothetical protein
MFFSGGRSSVIFFKTGDGHRAELGVGGGVWGGSISVIGRGVWCQQWRCAAICESLLCILMVVLCSKLCRNNSSLCHHCGLYRYVQYICVFGIFDIVFICFWHCLFWKPDTLFIRCIHCVCMCVCMYVCVCVCARARACVCVCVCNRP